MGVKDRLNRLQPRGDCLLCGYPSFRGREIELNIKLSVARKAEDGVIRTYDPDTGEELHPEEPEPCPECGHVQEPIRVKGIDDKPRR